MKITTFKHYLRLNLLRKGTERHKNIRKRRKILKQMQEASDISVLSSDSVEELLHFPGL
jgi:beta-galactosidase beta subunit